MITLDNVVEALQSSHELIDNINDMLETHEFTPMQLHTLESAIAKIKSAISDLVVVATDHS